MDKDKYLGGEGTVPSSDRTELCHILIECHNAYLEDVTGTGMAYEEFLANFFGLHKAQRDVCLMLKAHQPIITHRFKSSVFKVEDALAMLQEFDHCNSFFDRSLIDIQLKPIMPKLERDGVMATLVKCVNSTALFHERVEYADMMAILSGTSTKDYGIYNVSHFAYFMKQLERRRMTIQYWQSMIWNLSRIVYKGRYLNQQLVSSTVHNLGYLKRRPWIYDEIDDILSSLRII